MLVVASMLLQSPVVACTLQSQSTASFFRGLAAK
jgi:ribosomal protein S12 methylthiotransferase accessory factor YcaO